MQRPIPRVGSSITSKDRSILRIRRAKGVSGTAKLALMSRSSSMGPRLACTG
jgi:hypothetical protein